MVSSTESILSRLKNKSKIDNVAFQQLLNLFCQEEFIRRLAKSDYFDKLILKGGFLLYSISGFTTRPTVDADYLLKNYPNDSESIEIMIKSILKEKTGNEYIELEIRNIEKINQAKEYNGLRVNLNGLIGKTRTPFSIDFGVGDVIIPSAVKRTLPVILEDFTKPIVLTYSLESTISEKFDAIINLMEASGRMKDFYDIYYLASSFEFEGEKIQEAIYMTLNQRGTPYKLDSVDVLERLGENLEILNRWKNFCNKILKYELDFKHVIELISTFINPPFKSMVNENKFLKVWNPNEKNYN